MYKLWIDDHASGADLTLVSDPAPVGDDAGCADTGAQCGAERCELVEPSRVVEACSAGDDPIRFGEIDRRSIGWQHLLRRRVGSVGKIRSRRGRRRCRSDVISAADAGLQRRNERRRRFDRMQFACRLGGSGRSATATRSCTWRRADAAAARPTGERGRVRRVRRAARGSARRRTEWPMPLPMPPGGSRRPRTWSRWWATLCTSSMPAAVPEPTSVALPPHSEMVSPAPAGTIPSRTTITASIVVRLNGWATR